MKKEDTFYERQKKEGSGLPNDDLKKFHKEYQEKMKQEELKKKDKKKKGK